MAMKYPKTINLVRRIQLKFRDEGDFRKALDILKDLGLPITESSASVSRPSISPAQLPFPPISTPILGMSASNFQPPSAHPSLLPGTTISPIAMFKVPTRPDTRNAEIPRSDSTQSFAITSYNRSASASTALSAPTPPSSVSTLSPLYDMTKPHSLLYPVQHRRVHCRIMWYYYMLTVISLKINSHRTQPHSLRRQMTMQMTLSSHQAELNWNFLMRLKRLTATLQLLLSSHPALHRSH